LELLIGTFLEIAYRSKAATEESSLLEFCRVQHCATGYTISLCTMIWIRLEDEIIYRVLRRDIMQESSVYRSILAEGKAEGLAEGEARAKISTQREIALNLLRAGVLIEVIARGTGLSIEEVQQLQQQINQSPQH
jgi:predicted transposase/invertase (TIGR01784 family)